MLCSTPNYIQIFLQKLYLSIGVFKEVISPYLNDSLVRKGLFVGTRYQYKLPWGFVGCNTH